MRKEIIAVLAAVGLLAAGPGPAQPGGTVVPAAKSPIAGQYVVVLDEGVSDVSGTARRLAGKGRVLHTYRHALKGFAVQVSAKQARRIAADPAVASVQQDSVVRTVGDVSPATFQSVPAPPDTWWGLNRIDQRTAPPNTSGGYNYFVAGVATTAYVVDTGINYPHTQFGGRATLGIDTVGGIAPAGSDCHGHGTHVSGTIGGSTYGVAKGVKLRSVRVLDCGGSGSWAGVIAGLDWVRANAVRPAVVNMSLGGGFNIAINVATNDLVEAGVNVVVAAGNSNADAGPPSPSSTLAAVTVGATGDRFNPSAPITDARADYSNYGPCLDLFAPGSLIRSAWIGSTTAASTISGTSMAAPHVAGVVALYYGSAASSTLPATVRNYLIDFATLGVVTNPGPGSPNRLLFSGSAASLSINATPEPITSGQNVTSAGILSVGGKRLAGRTVTVWFDPAGAAPAVLKGSTVTSSTGFYTRTFPQVEDGYWFSRYSGAPLVGPGQSVLDFVDCTNC